MKRRFIRQNRELARVNSTQSLRIRNLEAEISRLLVENIALREAAIASAEEAQRLRSSDTYVRKIGCLKAQLESKLSDVNAIVTDLGNLHERGPQRRYLAQVDRRNSNFNVDVSEREGGKRRTVGGLIVGAEREGQESRLPAIMEGKYYPRQTLEAAELQRLVQEAHDGNSESPELGPPPVAHFDVADPIRFNTAQSTETSENDNVTSENRDEAASIPAPSESRKRRRETSFLNDMSALQIATSTNVSDEAVDDKGQSLNDSVRRRLSGTEDEVINGGCNGQHEEFSFQRKTTTSNVPLPRSRSSSRFCKPGSTQLANGTYPDSHPSPRKAGPAPARQPLAPKSTNSPTKATRAMTVDEKLAALKENVATHTKAREERTKGRKLKTGATASPLLQKQAESVERADVVLDGQISSTTDDLLPTTPAADLDLYSPTACSTNPSAKVNSTSEMAVTTSVEEILGRDLGRGSRRARIGVSYAEPNLKQKMRRPGKDFVAAVGEGDRFNGRETSPVATAESVDQVGEKGTWKPRVVLIKKEKSADNDLGWKNLPRTNREEPSSPLEERTGEAPPLATKKLSQHPPKASGGEQFEEAAPKLSIFDGPISSPHESKSCSPQDIEEDRDGPTADAATKIQTVTFRSRRHSANPGALKSQPSTSATSTSMKEQAEARANPSKDAHFRPPGSRPSSAANLRRETPPSQSGSAEDVADLTRPTGVKGRRGIARAGSDRLERTASRRRSLMI